MPPLPPANLVRELLVSAVLPSLAAAVAVLALSLIAGKQRGAAVGAALALAAGFAAGNYLRGVVPWVPERSAWHWLPAAALAALAAGLIARIPRVPVPVRFLLRAAACALAACLLAPADLRAEKSWLQPAFLLVVLVEWEVLEGSAGRSPGGGVPLGLALVFVGGAAVLIHAHSARLADVAFLVAAAFTGIAAVAWWARADGAGAMPGAAVLLPGLLLAGHSEPYSE